LHPQLQKANMKFIEISEDALDSLAEMVSKLDDSNKAMTRLITRIALLSEKQAEISSAVLVGLIEDARSLIKK